MYIVKFYGNESANAVEANSFRITPDGKLLIFMDDAKNPIGFYNMQDVKSVFKTDFSKTIM